MGCTPLKRDHFAAAVYPIARWSEKRFRLEHRLMAGLLIMTLAMMPIGLSSNLQQLFTLDLRIYIWVQLSLNPRAEDAGRYAG